MGLFDETATATPGKDVETSTSGLGSLVPKAIQQAVDDGLLNTNTVNTPLSDLKSILVRDATKVDPSFDISGVRTTTPTRPELLAAVPEFSGFEFDPTQRSYIEDLYALYAGGVPTRDVAMGDSAQIPGAMDTLVNVGGEASAMDQPAGDSVLDATPTETFAGQPATFITPGTTIDNVTGNITNPDGSFGGNIVDEVRLTGAAPSGITGDPIDVGIPDIESGFLDPLGTIRGAPVISPVLINQGPKIGTVDPTKAFRTTPLSDVELAEEGFRDPISKVTPPGFEPTVTINETPETFIDKTKNFLGLDNVDLPEFAIKAAINKTIGQPITLAFDLAKNIFDRQTTQDQGVTPDAGFADVAQNPVDEVALTGGDDFDVTNEAAVDVGTPSFEGFDSGGFDPAPAPAPAPAPSIPDRGRGDRGSGGGNQGGSSGGGESGFGGFCFDPNTPIQMADGSEKKIKEVQLGDQTKGGEVTGVFQFKAADEIHDYKGVTVAGSHYVKEDGRFIMVQNSPISVKINKIPVVYSLDTTGRRIFIKDIEFADYNGDGIAKGFLANAGVNISGFNEEVLRQVENRLI